MFTLLFSFIFYEINYIIIVCLIFSFTYYYVYKNNLTLEDQYQIDINKKNNTKASLIYVTLQYEDEIYFENILKNLKDKLNMYNCRYNLDQINNRILFDETHYIYYDKKLFINEEYYHYKFFIDKEKLKIYAYINHELIGGSYLLLLFYSFINTPQKSSDILFPKSSIFNLIYSLKLFYKYNNIPTIKNNFLPIIKDKNEIRRYKNKYNMCKNQKFSIKTIILYNIMKTLYNSLDLDRPLICYLPIAFQNYTDVKNNIGLMWLSFDNSDTVESIDRKIYESKYQILATNSLLIYKKNNKNISSSVRKNVDVVISFMIGTDNSNFEVSWTFENISEYPLYVSITSIMKENFIDITQTVTCCTSSFDVKKCENFNQIPFEDYKISI